MRRGGGVRTLIAGLATLVLVAAPLDAQRGPDRRDARDREQLEQRIRAQMGRMISDRLGLDSLQAAELADVVRGFDARRRALFRAEQETRRSVEALVRADSTDDEQAAALLERMAELRVQEAQLFAEEQTALASVLTPTQVLELQVLREQIGRRIRALRGDGDGDPGRRRRRGGEEPRDTGAASRGTEAGPLALRPVVDAPVTGCLSV